MYAGDIHFSLLELYNPIIYAECSIGYDRIEEAEALFGYLGVDMKPIPKEALFLAEKAFLQYREHQPGKRSLATDEHGFTRINKWLH